MLTVRRGLACGHEGVTWLNTFFSGMETMFPDDRGRDKAPWSWLSERFVVVLILNVKGLLAPARKTSTVPWNRLLPAGLISVLLTRGNPLIVASHRNVHRTFKFMGPDKGLPSPCGHPYFQALNAVNISLFFAVALHPSDPTNTLGRSPKSPRLCLLFIPRNAFSMPKPQRD